ncbi:MAG TPA: hypothetical protein VJA23_02390 [Candidatus Nanoarchaeia archaeon]|nr:hypothetical protein [Candidatus Nanoarchaeia archaeon]
MEEKYAPQKEYSKPQKYSKLSLVLNFFSLVLLLIVFFSLFSSGREFLYFSGYFLILFLGGFGFALFFRDFTPNSVIYLVISFLIGIIFNYVLFIILKFFNLNHSFSLFILLFAGLVSVILNFKKAKDKFFSITLLQDRHLPFLIILIIFSLFLFSDRMTYTSEGTYLHDQTHPIYELSRAQELKTMFPVEQLSYLGLESKYHFGFPILVYQLVNIFQIDGLSLIYILFPSFLIIITSFLLYELAGSFFENKKRLFFCWVIFFSTLSLPFGTITGIINTFFNLNIPSVDNPFFLFHQLLKMGSFTLAIMMSFALFILIRSEKRNYVLESILLLGLAATKSPFFAVVAVGYFIIFFLRLLCAEGHLFNLKNWSEFFVKNLIFVPGALYFLLFVAGTHQHNLWIPLLGSFNSRSVTLSPELLVPNAIFSLILGLLIYLGLGVVYLWPKIKSTLKKGGLTNSILKIRGNDPNLTYLSIIFSSYLLGIFIVEIVNGNNEQFLFPGYIFLSLLTYRYLFTLENITLGKIKTFFLFAFIMIILINSLFAGLFFVLPTIKQPFPYEDTGNNPLAVLKLKAFQSFVGKPTGLAEADCLHSKDLLESLKVLSTQSDGLVLFNPFHQYCDNYKVSSWEDIVQSHDGGFIRTALSGKQALIEGYSSKGVITGKDYCERTYEALLFYSTISGEKNMIKESLVLFSNSKTHHYKDFSYYSYFMLFSKENYFTLNQDFVECITKKIKGINTLNLDLNFIQKYLMKNNIAYILFEKSQVPLPEYQELLRLSLIYSSGSVQLFKVNLVTGYPSKIFVSEVIPD